jgi:hypothetical protein
VLNNDRKIFLIEEAAHDLQYAPGSSRMPVLVNARTAWFNRLAHLGEAD